MKKRIVNKHGKPSMRRALAGVGLGVLLLGSILGITGCAGNSQDYYNHELQPEDKMTHTKMLEDSLLSVGNTARLQKAIAKAKRGEDVNMVFLGGSITEGIGANTKTCYAYCAYSEFTNTYGDGKNVHYYNSGISGTPSTLGLVRSAQDVLAYEPDIVFIEFAVNDGTDQTSLKMYESLVKRLLTSETEPAVILIFNRTENGYSAQSYQQAIGQKYDLGMISVNDAITAMLASGEITWADYSNDSAHPNLSGHAWISQMISHYMVHAYNTGKSTYQLPEDTAYGTPYENPVNLTLESSEVTSAGSFTKEEAHCYSYTYGMCHKDDAGNDPLVIEGEFSRLVIAYEQFNSTKYGDLEVYVDGQKVATFHGNDSNAWGNVTTQVVYDQESAAQHKVEMKMAAGSEEKPFVLLDIVTCK